MRILPEALGLLVLVLFMLDGGVVMVVGQTRPAIGILERGETNRAKWGIPVFEMHTAEGCYGEAHQIFHL